MALPTLDATFASSADLPRRQMLAKWLVEELGSGSIADYYDLPERYLWAKIAVAAGAPREEAAYISLPKNHAWSDIYNAVAGSSGNHTDWSENVALGHIAAAYRGDTETPENLATYIDWPWRYKVASIIGGVGPSTDSDVLSFIEISGATDTTGLNAFVIGIKNLGLWNSMVIWPLRSTQNTGTGTTAYSLGGLGTYNGTLVNGPAWDVDGITFDDNDDYISTSLSLESLPQVGFFGFYANTESTEADSGTIIGAGNASSGQAMGLQYRPEFDAYPYGAFYGGDLNGGGAATTSFIATACAYGTGYRRLWRGGTLVADSADAVTIGNGSVAIGGKPAIFEFLGGTVALAAVIVGPLETSTVSAVNSLYQQTLGLGIF